MTQAPAVAERADTPAIPTADPTTELDGGERLQVVDTLLGVFEGAYCHLPQKRAAYAQDPVQALRLLRRRCVELGDEEFHRAVTAILINLRDGHSRYHGPTSRQGLVAVLPFLVESYVADGRHRYVVSKVGKSLAEAHPSFAAGVELVMWNGVPMARAVEMHAEQETGSHPDARRMCGLQSLTARSLGHGPRPDERWVQVGFRTSDGAQDEVRVAWRDVEPGGPPAPRGGSPTALRWAADPAGEAIRRAKKQVFATAPAAEAAAEPTPTGTDVTVAPPAPGAAIVPTMSEASAVPPDGTAGSDSPVAPRPLATEPPFKSVLRASVVTTPRGELGHLRVFSFDVEDDDAFLAEVARLVALLPQDGLVVDLRGNPGGLVWAAERMLQLFADTETRQIQPTRFSLLASPLTRAMAASPFNRFELDAWAISLEEAVATGEAYSRPLPLTDPEWCNDLERAYAGPVIAVVDGLTYSAGDLFAAGWVDNGVGPLVAVGQATGGGGANVWTDAQLRDALWGTGEEVDALPDGVGFSISVRRAIRSGLSDGVPLEDLGVAGIPYDMTQQDLLNDNCDLLAFCAEQLKS